GRAVAGHGRALPGHAVVSGPRLRGRPCARAVAGARAGGAHPRGGRRPEQTAPARGGRGGAGPGGAARGLSGRRRGAPGPHPGPCAGWHLRPRPARHCPQEPPAQGPPEKVDRARRYRLPPAGVRTLAALLVLREHVIKPLLAGTAKPKMGRKPKTWTRVDAHYEALRKEMHALFDDLGLAAA